MANIGAYSRHKMLAEVRQPLFTNFGDGAVPLVYSPDEQRAKILAELMTVDDPVGVTVTTGATTAVAGQTFDGITRLTDLTLTAFAIGTSGDGASLGIGASLVSFPTNTIVDGVVINGTFSVAAEDFTNTMTVGFGTTIASGAVSVLSGTAAFENAMRGSLTAALADTGSASTVVANLSNVGGVTLVTTTPGLALFFNVAAAWTNAAAAAAVTFTGTVQIRTRDGL